MDSAVRALAELKPEDKLSAGGKGGTLARLYQAGYPVPDGFVIPPTAFTGDDLLPDSEKQVQACLTKLRHGDSQTTFAVRSSAVAEDSVLASFAGEFETVLDAGTDEEVFAAIDTVRQSRHSERVKVYSQAQGVSTAHEMAVVVQRMVRAEISGVLFTADPVTGDRLRMVGNYVHGLGEKLVAGESSSIDFTIERLKYKFNGPSEMKRFARRLYKLAIRLEKDLGNPQDIEWAISKNSLYVLQSRPITTMIGFNPVTGESNDSLTGNYAWHCVNLAEAMSDVMTPFTWSFTWSATHGWVAAFNAAPGYPAVGNIGGRAYANATVAHHVNRPWEWLLRTEDMTRELFADVLGGEYLEQMGQYLLPLPGASFLAMLPGSLRAQITLMKGQRNTAALVADNPGWCRAICRRIQDMQSRTEMTLLWVNEVNPCVLRTYYQVVATAFGYSNVVGKLRRELIELGAAADADVLLSHVGSHDELLESLGPVVGLSRVARGKMSREAYLEKWGHRGATEIEASTPRPFEDPEWLDRELAAFNQSPVDAEALLATRRAEFDAAWERLRARHPRRARAVRRRLEKSSAACHEREAVRSELARLVWVIRTWVRRAGELTGTGDGAFFLTVEELLDLLAGDDTKTAYIPARRQTYERYKALPPYPLVICGRFDPFKWAEDPERRNDIFDSHGLLSHLAVKAENENTVLGTPGAAGRVEGLVRRLDSPEDGDQLEPGEILVASQTNIGWTLLFPRLGGIVTDIGAPLSHAAVVARELGIPAVVNCGDATTRLQTGDRVRVDGAQGTVEILSRKT